MKWRIEVREADKAFLYVECEHGTHHGREVLECARSLWRRPALTVDGVDTMWQWDGNLERPTISPSINCNGGCGRHFTMGNGVPA